MIAMHARSPFPGMDPWLERYWGDVHTEVIVDLRRQIEPQLPDDLFVTIEESVYLVADEPAQTYKPDVGLFEGGSADSSIPAGPADADVAVAEPVKFLLPTESATEVHLEIRHLIDDQPLVTAIEVLSRTDKLTSAGRAEYLEKRRSYQRANVNVLEVDLLRGGRDLTGVADRDLARADGRLPSAYRCSVRRPRPSGAVALDLYPLPLRERLSRVRVPLRPGDPAVTVDLQQPIDAVYRLGRFGRRIDYADPPDPPLSPDDAAWAAARVAGTAG